MSDRRLPTIDLSTLLSLPLPSLPLLIKPLTPQQSKVLAVIRSHPGQTIGDYARLAFVYNIYFTRKKVQGAIEGLNRRGLLSYYLPCHCGWILYPHGKNAHQCPLCKSVYANVYLPKKVMKVRSQ